MPAQKTPILLDGVDEFVKSTGFTTWALTPVGSFYQVSFLVRRRQHHHRYQFQALVGP